MLRVPYSRLCYGTLFIMLDRLYQTLVTNPGTQPCEIGLSSLHSVSINLLPS